MYKNQFLLLGKRRFLPIFITQFLGAFNDNTFKNALVILITYKVSIAAGYDPQIIVTMAAGIFVLPFFLFSALAGQIADKHEKSRLIRIIKLAEIFIMCGAVAGFYLSSVSLLMAILFIMGAQSAFFGPLKYSILPDHLEKDELVGGNGLVGAATFIAILTGTIFGGLAILGEHGVELISTAIISIALIGCLASYFIPKTSRAAPDIKINYNIFKETWTILQHSKKNKSVFLAILGISWFWLVGAIFLSQFPAFTRDFIGGDEGVVTLFFSTFSIGIAVGSLICNQLLAGKIHAKYVPWAAFGLTVFTLDLVWSTHGSIAVTGDTFLNFNEYIKSFGNLRLLADIFFIGICGGIYTVPLHTILQTKSEDAHRSRSLASNNILNSLFMVIAATLSIAMLAMKFTIPQIFLTIAIMNAVVAIYICKILPAESFKIFIKLAAKILYNPEIKGIENYKAAGEKVLVISNHISFADAPILACFLPDKLTFAVNTHTAESPIMKHLIAICETHPLAPTNPMAMKTLIEKLKNNQRVMIFPEGRITRTGSLMKIYEGPGIIADKADAKILPIYIDGPQYSYLSRLKGIVRRRLFTKARISILPARKLNIPDDVDNHTRRKLALRELENISMEGAYRCSDYKQTLFQGLLNAKKIHGGKHKIIEDVQRSPLDYDDLITRSFILSEKLAQQTKYNENVGILLPNTTNIATTFFALQAISRTPAMLNFSIGMKNILSACRTAEIKTIISSKQFIEKAKLNEVVKAIKESGIKMLYLEDVAKKIRNLDKLKGSIACKFPSFFYKSSIEDIDKKAVVLFTSGSEGEPKGVVLSHRNLRSNMSQLRACVDFNPKDRIFNALPIFHSFGLSVGMLLPILGGIKTFLYPSPLDYKIIPEMVYDTGSTIMFGTDTFLSGYARFAHPYDFSSLRFVFAGAEKLKEETRKTWLEKFGVRIFQGYGVTETSPVLSMNTPMHNKSETVGQLIPGIEYRLDPIEGVKGGGRLVVRGENIMLGYLFPENPGKLEEPKDGWHDTGDIVEVDEEGFITIKGRAKRFAKIGGEMISLAAVEGMLSELWPGQQHAVVSLPDPKKGEQLTLVTDFQDAERKAIVSYANQQGMTPLSVPRNIIIADKIPALATGKTDYPAVKILAEK